MEHWEHNIKHIQTRQKILKNEQHGPPLKKGKWIFSNDQSVCDCVRRIVVAKTSTHEQRGIVVVFASAAGLCPENHCMGTSPRLTYEL